MHHNLERENSLSSERVTKRMKKENHMIQFIAKSRTVVLGFYSFTIEIYLTIQLNQG